MSVFDPSKTQINIKTSLDLNLSDEDVDERIRFLKRSLEIKREVLGVAQRKRDRKMYSVSKREIERILSELIFIEGLLR